MPEQLWLTQLLNHLFAGPLVGLLRAFHIEPAHPQAPISNAVAMQLFVFVFLVMVFFLVRSRLSVDAPGALQHIFEGVDGFINRQSEEVIGHHSQAYTPFLAALGYFILVSNLLGLIPGFESPTASPVVPLGCAICAFFYYQTQGFKHGGIAYLKHFMGPFWWLAIIMVPIELISHVARVLSLTIRLWANMFAGDLVTMAFFSMVPIALPTIFMGLHVGVAFLQTYIFLLLTTVYLQGAVSEEH